MAGIEGDVYVYLDSEEKAPIAFTVNGAALQANYGGSVRAQVGYAFDRFLPYVTAGVAFIDYEGGTTLPANGPIFPGTTYDDTRAGWTVGAGLAYAFTDHIVGHVEYRYADYGSKTYNTPGVITGRTKLDLNEHAVRLGIGYKF